MGALPRHVPDAAIAGNSILASVPAPEHAGSRPRRRLNRDLRTVVAVMVATEYFTAALASYLASLIYGWGFVGSTLPEIMDARRYLAGPLGHVVRGMLGISIAKELVELELFVLAVCLLLGLYVRLGVSSTFQLLAPWRELLAIRW